MIKEKYFVSSFVLNIEIDKKNPKNCYMYMWTSSFQNSLIHIDFNMFVDE